MYSLCVSLFCVSPPQKKTVHFPQYVEACKKNIYRISTHDNHFGDIRYVILHIIHKNLS